jgi:hypothetical protein
MVTEKRGKAIQNNLDLYKIILGSHQVESFETDDLWYCLERTPPLYSNLITKEKTWAPDSIFEAINRIYETKQWAEWSVKDSFGTLNLTGYGFLKLFDAQWIYLSCKNFSIRNDHRIQFKIVKDEGDLLKWIKAWEAGEAESAGNKIFKSTLLANGDVYFVTAYQGTQIIGGCLINTTDKVLGISNSFGPERDIHYWSSLISFVLENIAPLDIVGYIGNELLRLLMSLSFAPVGGLSVWLKKKNS